MKNFSATFVARPYWFEKELMLPTSFIRERPLLVWIKISWDCTIVVNKKQKIHFFQPFIWTNIERESFAYSKNVPNRNPSSDTLFAKKLRIAQFDAYYQKYTFFIFRKLINFVTSIKFLPWKWVREVEHGSKRNLKYHSK